MLKLILIAAWSIPLAILLVAEPADPLLRGIAGIVYLGWVWWTYFWACDQYDKRK